MAYFGACSFVSLEPSKTDAKMLTIAANVMTIPTRAVSQTENALRSR
jgi:hypothetical protein